MVIDFHSATFFKLPGAVDNNKRRNLKDVINVPPAFKLGQHIAADNEEKLGIARENPPKIPQGINGIRFPLFFDFKIGNFKVGIPFDRQAHHIAPVMYWRQALRAFVRRPVGGHKNDLLKLHGLLGCLGNSQMPDMNGVKGPAQNTDSSQRLTCPFP